MGEQMQNYGIKDKILLVDDYPDNIRLLKKLLEDHYLIKWAYTGEEAVEIADEFKPDILLLDIGLPDISGYKVCRRIKQLESCLETKVVMLTARTRTEDRLKGYEAGADDYLTKPFNGRELLAKLKVFSQLKSLQRLDSMKNNLLSLLTHEVQTPLNSIIPPLEFLVSDRNEMPDKEQDELLQLILKSSKGLFQLFEKVKLLCELKSGLYNLHLIRYNLIEGFLDSIHCLLVDPVSYENSVTDLSKECLADLNLIHKCFKLLFGYIHRHFGEKYSVKISFCDECQCLIYEVDVHSNEISTDDLSCLFEDLSEEAVLHHHHSDNIDLAIVHNIINLHMGNLVFRRGKGLAKVVIHIPVCSKGGFVNQVISKDCCFRGE